jgi:hypothetical protein
LGFFNRDLKKLVNPSNALIFGLVLCLLNYLLLYKDKKHEDVFNSFDRSPLNFKKWDLPVRIYINCSIALFLMILIFADLINQGKISI